MKLAWWGWVIIAWAAWKYVINGHLSVVDPRGAAEAQLRGVEVGGVNVGGVIFGDAEGQAVANMRATDKRGLLAKR